MKSENTKLSEKIKSVTNEMSRKTEVTNKNLMDSLTKQFREESESFRKEVSNKPKPKIFNITEAMNQLRNDTDLEVTSLRNNVNIVHEKLDNKMNENMSVVQSR